MTSGATPGGWRGPASAGALALATVIALSWPAIQAPQDWVIGASHNDAHGILWGLDHVAQSISEGRLPALHVDTILYPDGAPLRVANLPEAILVTPLTLWLGAIASYNVLILLHHALGAAAGWWCGRRMGQSSGGSAILAVACGFAPVLNATTFNQNPDVTAWYWIPLTAGLAWQAKNGWVLMGAALCATTAALCNPYGGVMATAAFLCLAPWRPLTQWALGAIPLTAGLTAAWWLYAIPASASGSATAKVARDNLNHGVASPLELLQPWPTIFNQDSTWDVAVVAHYPYLGLTLIGLGIYGMMRRPNGRLWLMLSTGLLLSLGPANATYANLEALTPLGKLHLSHRFTFLAVLSLAAIVARSLGPRTTWLAAAVIAADLIGSSGANLFRPSAPFDDGACEVLSELPPGPVFDLPGERGEQWMWASVCHGRPTASGLNKAMSPALEAQLRVTPQDKRLALLHNSGFRYLVHHGRSRRMELGTWPGLRRAGAGCVVATNRQGVEVIDLRCTQAATTTHPPATPQPTNLAPRPDRAGAGPTSP